MKIKIRNLQKKALKVAIKQGFEVLIYLKNGVKLKGQLLSFDDCILLLSVGTKEKQLLVYRHAINTVVPSLRKITANW